MTPFILPMPKSASLKDLATWKKSADEAGVDRIWFANDAEGLQQDVASRALCATDSDVVVLCSPDDCSRKPAFLQEVSATIGLLAASCEEDVAVGLKTECLEHAATLGAVTLDGIVVGLSLSKMVDFHSDAKWGGHVRTLPELTTIGIVPRDRFLRQVIDRISVKGSHSKGERGRIATTALRAGLLLLTGYVEESHAASQSIEGEGSLHTGDYWHAILHRREPDYGNAKYWFRHVGRHPNFQRLAELVQPMLDDSTGLAAAELGRWKTRLLTSQGWDAFAFVDFCQAAERQPELKPLGEVIQWMEMLLLIESSCQPEG